MTRFPLSAILVAGTLAGTAASAQDALPSPLVAGLAGPAAVSTRALDAVLLAAAGRRSSLAFGDAAAPEPSLAPRGMASEAILALAAAQGGPRPAGQDFAADFEVATGSPAPTERTAPRQAPAADDGLAASGGFDLGPRLRLDFESGLHYTFSANLTGVIGYGDVAGGDGGGLSLDGPSLGFTFRF
jgi:hypothetical protein